MKWTGPINHYIYRGFDEHGLLLYIGCTLDVTRRMKQHRTAGVWTETLDRLDVEGPFERYEALEMEAAAIRAERPYFNAQPEHTALIQANRNAATTLLNSLDIDFPRDAPEEYHRAWYTARNAIGVMIRDRYPVVDEDVRKGWYLAERERRTAPAPLADTG